MKYTAQSEQLQRLQELHPLAGAGSPSFLRWEQAAQQNTARSVSSAGSQSQSQNGVTSAFSTQRAGSAQNKAPESNPMPEM